MDRGNDCLVSNRNIEPKFKKVHFWKSVISMGSDIQ
jgi:hypothetical protein